MTLTPIYFYAISVLVYNISIYVQIVYDTCGFSGVYLLLLCKGKYHENLIMVFGIYMLVYYKC